MPQDEKPSWIDKSENVTKIYYGVWLVCALLAVADLFYHKHTIMDVEAFPAFYGLYGFIGCVGLVLGAKEMRKILMRDEDYYDR